MQAIDYTNALAAIESMPKYYLGQEINTPDGKGIIVQIKMDWNRLYISPKTGSAVVWYSTEGAVEKKEGGRWVSFTYSLTELDKIKAL